MRGLGLGLLVLVWFLYVCVSMFIMNDLVRFVMERTCCRVAATRRYGVALRACWEAPGVARV